MLSMIVLADCLVQPHAVDISVMLLHGKAVQGFPRVPAQPIDAKSARASLVVMLLVRLLVA